MTSLIHNYWFPVILCVFLTLSLSKLGHVKCIEPSIIKQPHSDPSPSFFYYNDPPIEGREFECLPGWFLWNTHCYGFFPVRKSWENAAKDCNTYGASLTRIEDFDTNVHLNRMAQRLSQQNRMKNPSQSNSHQTNDKNNAKEGNYLRQTEKFNQGNNNDKNENENENGIVKRSVNRSTVKMELNENANPYFWIGLRLSNDEYSSEVLKWVDSQSSDIKNIVYRDEISNSIESTNKNITWIYDGFWSPTFFNQNNGLNGIGLSKNLPNSNCVALSIMTQNTDLIDYETTWYLKSCQEVFPFICRSKACLKGYFRCLDGSCINERYVCDGLAQCPDNSDEANCDVKECIYYMSGLSGVIQSPNYPNNYGRLLQCQWVIEGPIGTQLQFKFVQMKLEPIFDTIFILGGSTQAENAVMVTKLSGLNNSNAIDQIFNSPNHVGIVKFDTDDSVEYTGFSLAWTTVKMDCIQELEARNQWVHILSPNHPLPYANGVECVWTIKVPNMEDNQIISLKVNSLDLEFPNDYLEIRDGSTASAPLLATLTGQLNSTDLPQFVISTQPALYLYFFADEAHSDKGFNISFRLGCKIESDAKHGALFSPGQGLKPYPKFQNCEWIINLKHIASNITIYIDKFDVHYSDLLRITSIGQVIDDKSEIQMVETLQFDSSKVTNDDSFLLSKFVITTGIVKMEFFTDSVGFGTGYIASYSINCERIDEQSKHLILSTKETSFKTVVELKCQKGFRFLSGDAVIITYCKSGGKWNLDTIPSCIAQDEDIGCGPVPQLPNAIIVKATNVSFGGRATYACTPGNTFKDGETLKDSLCDRFGRWENLLGCIPIKNCKPQFLLKNGYITLLNGNGTSSGTILKMQCFKGFSMQGSPITRCMNNGKWTQDLPICQPVLCPIPKIHNGYVKFNFNEKLGQKFIYGKSVQIICLPGYRLTGPSVLTCHPNVGNPNSLTQGKNNDYLVYFNTAIPTCDDINECAENPYICDMDSTLCHNLFGGYECQCRASRIHGNKYLTTSSNDLLDYIPLCEVPLSLYHPDGESLVSGKTINLLSGFPTVDNSGSDIDSYLTTETIQISNSYTSYAISHLHNSEVIWQKEQMNTPNNHFPFLWCLKESEKTTNHYKIMLSLKNSFLLQKIYLQVKQMDNLLPFSEDISDDLIPKNIYKTPGASLKTQGLGDDMLNYKLSLRYSKNGIDFIEFNEISSDTLLSNLTELNATTKDFITSETIIANNRFFLLDFTKLNLLIEATHLEFTLNTPKDNPTSKYYNNYRACLGIAITGCRRYKCPFDANPCSKDNNNAGCSHICSPANNEKGYECTCPAGWKLYTAENPSLNGQLKLNHSCLRINCGKFPISQLKNGQLMSKKFWEDDVLTSSVHDSSPVKNILMLYNDVQIYTNDKTHMNSVGWYQDAITMSCNVGYQLAGHSVSRCEADGKWTNLEPLPKCDYAFCKNLFINDDKSESGLLTVNSDAPFVSYGSAVRFQCSKPGYTVGNTAYSGHRFCMYHPKTLANNNTSSMLSISNYEMYGDPAKCKPISCGKPMSLPLSLYTYHTKQHHDDQDSETDYIFNSQFSLSCVKGGVLIGNSSYGDNIVRCGFDGLWDFGDLRCTGPSCSDPGIPVYGKQIADSYEVDSIVKFECVKKGYQPSFSAIKCLAQYDENDNIVPRWNITNPIPQCLDIEPPKFLENPLCTPTPNITETNELKILYLTNTTNGPVFDLLENLHINAYMDAFGKNIPQNLGYPLVKAQDNSGLVVKYEVYPYWFSISNYPKHLTNQIIQFRAYDLAGNVGYCLMKIVIRDINPPKIECPISYTHYLPLNFTIQNDAIDPDFDEYDDEDTIIDTREVKERKQNIKKWIAMDSNKNGGNKKMQSPVHYMDITSLFPIKVSDDSGAFPKISYNVDNPHKVAISINSFILVIVSAVDGSGNTAFCSFQISVKYSSCSELVLLDSLTDYINPKYLNSHTTQLKLPLYKCYTAPKIMNKKNQTNPTIENKITNENESICQFKCPPGFLFINKFDMSDRKYVYKNLYENMDDEMRKSLSLSKQIDFKCSPSTRNQWYPQKYVPLCIQFSNATQPSHTLSIAIQYRSSANDIQMSDKRCLDFFKNQILNEILPTVTSDLQKVCTREGLINVRVLLKSVDINENEMSLRYRFLISVAELTTTHLNNENEYEINKCISALRIIFDLKLKEIRPLMKLDISRNNGPPNFILPNNCPEKLFASYTTLETGKNWCPSDTSYYTHFHNTNDDDENQADINIGKKLVLLASKETRDSKRCIKCPIGTYVYNATCIPCPHGTYQDKLHESVCKICPVGMTTETVNSISIDQCKLMCIPGTYSSYSNNNERITGSNGGLVPCTACPKNTFSRLYGSPICIPCPGRKITSGVGASSIDYCIEPCPLGFYSPTGQIPCQPCPRMYYQDERGATHCKECPKMLTTFNTGATSLLKCYESIEANFLHKFSIEEPTVLKLIPDPKRRNEIFDYNIMNLIPPLPQEFLSTLDTGNKTSNYSYDYLSDLEHNLEVLETGPTASTYFKEPISSFKELLYGMEILSIKTNSNKDDCEKDCWDSLVCSAFRYWSEQEMCGLFSISSTNKPESLNMTLYIKNQKNEPRLITKRDIEDNPSQRLILIKDLSSAHFCSFGHSSENAEKMLSQSLGCTGNRILTFIDASFEAIYYNTAKESESLNKTLDDYLQQMINTSWTFTQTFSSDPKVLARHRSNVCQKIFETVSQFVNFNDGTDINKNIRTGLMTLPISLTTNHNKNNVSITNCEHKLQKLYDTIENCEGHQNCHLTLPEKCLIDYFSTHFDGNTKNVLQLVGRRFEVVMDCVPNPCDYAGDDYCNNGGKCHPVNHMLTCKCPPGFIGPKCDYYVSPCLISPCLNGGECKEQINFDMSTTELSTLTGVSPMKFVCICPEGFSGKFCQIGADYCKLSRAGNNASSLDEHYPCKNSGMCMNTNSGYTCLCRIGFSGLHCENFAEGCNNNPCRNGATCHSMPLGRFWCECPPGWEGSDCNKNIDDCAERPCGPNAKCVDGHRRYYCKCPIGFTGLRCTVKISFCSMLKYQMLCNAGNPLNNAMGSEIRGTCYDTLLGYACKCNYGYYGKNCEKAIDWCKTNPCQNLALCRNNGSQFHCQCRTGYSGLLCEHNEKDCEQQPCLNGGWCSPQTDGKKCVCPSGYTGDRCEANYDPCKTAMCHPNNTQYCIPDIFNKDNNINYRCMCKYNHYGLHCEQDEDLTVFSTSKRLHFKQLTDNSICSPNLICLNGGTCESHNKCNCLPGWEGTQCERMSMACTVPKILHNPKENFENYTHKSILPLPCQPNDIADISSLRTPNKCLNVFPNDYYCQCQLDQNLEETSLIDQSNTRLTKKRQWSVGKDCEIVSTNNDNPCAGNPCKNGGTCNYFVRNKKAPGSHHMNKRHFSVTCTCPLGSYGTFCEIKKDPCEAKPCRNGATCISLYTAVDNDLQHKKLNNSAFPGKIKSPYICVCPKGLVGFHCEHNPNDCTFSSCPKPSKCMDELGGYHCECPLSMAPVHYNNRTLLDCDKGLSKSFDLRFYGKEKAAYSTFLHGQNIRYDTIKPAFSISLWIKFTVPEDSGMFFTLLSATDTMQEQSITIDNDEDATSIRMKEQDILITMNHFGIRLALFETQNEQTLGENMNGQASERSNKNVGGEGNTNTRIFIPFDPFVINDGEWHHISFVYLDGKYGIILDSEPLAHGSYDKNLITLPRRIKIVLGSLQSYFHDTQNTKNGQGFRGLLRDVQFWTRALRFPEELDDGGKCHSSSISDQNLLITWTAFLTTLKGKVYPQWHTNDAEAYPCHESPKNTFKNKMSKIKGQNAITDAPVLVKELDNIRIVLREPKKEVIVTWPEPVFLNKKGRVTKIEQNYFSGDIFTWGHYLIKYMAFDDDGNYAIAKFSLYVMKEDCPPIHKMDTYLNETCTVWGQSQFYDSKKCTINCKKTANTPTYLTLTESNSFTCSESGVWKPRFGLPQCKLPYLYTYPLCSRQVTQKERYVIINLKYSNGENSNVCASRNSESLDLTLNSMFNNLIRDNQDLCMLINCSTAQSNLTSGNNEKSVSDCTTMAKETSNTPFTIFKYTQKIKLIIPSSSSSNTNHSLITSSATSIEDKNINELHLNKLLEWLQLRITNPHSEFNALNVSANIEPNAILKLMHRSFSIHVQYECPKGSIFIDNVCSKCAMGSFYETSTRKCKLCPYNTYQDKEGETYCNLCPKNLTTGISNITLCQGASSIHSCIRPCEPGSYFKHKLSPGTPFIQGTCVKCPKGFYQPNNGAFECLACPIGYTTFTDGNINKDPPINRNSLHSNQSSSQTVINDKGHQVLASGCYRPCHCLNGGKCVYANGPNQTESDKINILPSCNCPYPYGGARCEVIVSETCLPSCKNNQPCRQVEKVMIKKIKDKVTNIVLRIVRKRVKKWKCVCGPRFGGNQCEMICPVPCKTGTRCLTDELGNPTCMPSFGPKQISDKVQLLRPPVTKSDKKGNILHKNEFATMSNRNPGIISTTKNPLCVFWVNPANMTESQKRMCGLLTLISPMRDRASSPDGDHDEEIEEEITSDGFARNGDTGKAETNPNSLDNIGNFIDENQYAGEQVLNPNDLQNKEEESAALSSQDISIISGAIGGVLLLLVMMGLIMLSIIYWRKRVNMGAKYFGKPHMIPHINLHGYNRNRMHLLDHQNMNNNNNNTLSGESSSGGGSLSQYYSMQHHQTQRGIQGPAGFMGTTLLSSGPNYEVPIVHSVTSYNETIKTEILADDETTEAIYAGRYKGRPLNNTHMMQHNTNNRITTNPNNIYGQQENCVNSCTYSMDTLESNVEIGFTSTPNKEGRSNQNLDPSQSTNTPHGQINYKNVNKDPGKQCQQLPYYASSKLVNGKHTSYINPCFNHNLQDTYDDDPKYSMDGTSTYIKPNAKCACCISNITYSSEEAHQTFDSTMTPENDIAVTQNDRLTSPINQESFCIAPL